MSTALQHAVKDRATQVLFDAPDDLVSPEVARLVNYRMRTLIGTPLYKQLKSRFLDREMPPEVADQVQAMLNARWNALVVEFRLLEKISAELMPHGVAITGLTLRNDPDRPNQKIVVPIVAVVR